MNPAPRILFVTGTGTDIGKTALSLAVLLWARARGLKPGYLKPVQCGARDALFPGDADWITAACPEVLEASAVYTFPDAVSPHLAAERAGVWIDAEWIGEQAAAAARRCDLLVIEGAGGAAVPLNRDGLSLADVAAAGGWPCLIAAQPGLGTLHHTVTTAHFLAARGARAAGFAFVQNTPDVSPLQADNAATLRDLARLPFFGTVPHCPGLGKRPPLSPAVAALLAASLPGLDAWHAGTAEA
jgi:dethiobiotin synthetase